MTYVSERLKIGQNQYLNQGHHLKEAHSSPNYKHLQFTKLTLNPALQMEHSILMRGRGKLLCPTLKGHQTSPLGHMTMILYWLWIWSTVGFLWPPMAGQMVHYGQDSDVCQEKECYTPAPLCPWATDVALIWRLLVLLNFCWGNNCVKLICSQRFHANCSGVALVGCKQTKGQ